MLVFYLFSFCHLSALTDDHNGIHTPNSTLANPSDEATDQSHCVRPLPTTEATRLDEVWNTSSQVQSSILAAIPMQITPRLPLNLTSTEMSKR